MNFSSAVTEAKAGWRARAHLPVLGLVIAAHAIAFLTYEPGDLVVYVSHWYERVHSLGFGAFSQPFSNYTPPYLYLLWAASLVGGDASPILVIKWVAVVGAAWLTLHSIACSPRFRSRAPGLGRPRRPAASKHRSQRFAAGPGGYVLGCRLRSGAQLGNQGPIPAGSPSGAASAFAFKAQAVFFAPFVMHLFLNRRAPWWCWAMPALVYVAAMLPAWLAGWNWWYLVNVYFRQAAWQPEGRLFISNGGSWWTIFGHFAPGMAIRFFPFGYILAALGTVAYLRLRPHYSPMACSRWQR